MKTFEMSVRETFYLKGLTIFMGPVSPDVGFIRRCDCELVANGRVMAQFSIEGEAHPLPEDPMRRSIATKQPVDLGSLGLGPSGFIIRSRD
jgi:hypothetical protein